MVQEKRFRTAVFIAGNHDVTLDLAYYERRGARRFHTSGGREAEDPRKAKEVVTNAWPHARYLEDAGLRLGGLHFWGFPSQPAFCDWAFNDSRAELVPKWAAVPSDVDVLLSHGPAQLHGDGCDKSARLGPGSVSHEGDGAQLAEILSGRLKPAVAIAGHIHEGRGATTHAGCKTLFVNASTCTFRYAPTQLPIVVDVPRRPISTYV